MKPTKKRQEFLQLRRQPTKGSRERERERERHTIEVTTRKVVSKKSVALKAIIEKDQK